MKLGKCSCLKSSDFKIGQSVKIVYREKDWPRDIKIGDIVKVAGFCEGIIEVAIWRPIKLQPGSVFVGLGGYTYYNLYPQNIAPIK